MIRIAPAHLNKYFTNSNITSQYSIFNSQYLQEYVKLFSNITSASQSLPEVQISLMPAPSMKLFTRFHSSSDSKETRSMQRFLHREIMFLFQRFFLAMGHYDPKQTGSVRSKGPETEGKFTCSSSLQ